VQKKITGDLVFFLSFLIQSTMKRKVKGISTNVKPRVAREGKDASNSRYLSVEILSEIRNKLLSPDLNGNDKKKMRKNIRETYNITNPAVTQIISEKYPTTNNDNIRIGAAMNPDMFRPQIHNEQHLKLDHAVLSWIRKQKNDPLLKQLPLPRSTIIAEAVRVDHELKLGVFKFLPSVFDDEDSENDSEDINEVFYDFSLDSDSEDSDYGSDEDRKNGEDDASWSDISEADSIDIEIDTAEELLTNKEHFTWYYNFLYRYRIKRKVAHGEASSCPMDGRERYGEMDK
jgi:hypothetical protein